MSKSKFNYKVYNGKSIKKLLQNSRIYLLTSLFAAGIIIGAISIHKDSLIIEKLTSLIDSYAILKAGQGITANFCNSLTVNAIFAAFNLFLGFSLIGYPLIIWLPFLRGLGIGGVCGYLYSTYRLTGLAYSLLIIYPGAIVSTFAFMLACNDSCEYSKNAYLKSISGRGQFEKNETKVFIIREALFFAVSGVSAIIDALFSAGFSRFFDI
ncbi:MAG: stage II sporulation protein M [Clostridia bacterium]|nr:stage II sporulation protein M [Clostridia bacterium]